jgi:glyoxylase-like metal-dependent hydrolase (beta-lactamase superfamily II)
MKKLTLFIIFLISSPASYAAFDVKKVTDGVYALVGETTQRSPTNFGNNSTHGVIITDDGVVLIDSGASYLGAREIHQAIQTLTDQPIKIVINTGGQDHRWLGNDYFQTLGARIIASKKTQNDQKARADYQMSRLSNLIGESLNNTRPVFANEVFDTEKQIEIGDISLELYHAGAAHTVGDIFIYMPSQRVMFAGDIVFNDRMLGVGPAQNVQSWIDVFEKMASFRPKYIVPGHGQVSDLSTASKNTLQYLKFLKKQIAEILENDGDMLEASKINQSKFHFLSGYESIAGKNAQWVFEQMEFDY